MVSIPACHAGDRGSIPRRGGVTFNVTNTIDSLIIKDVAQWLGGGGTRQDGFA